MKLSSEMPQNLLYFIYKKTHVLMQLFPFYILCNFTFLPYVFPGLCRNQYNFFVHTYLDTYIFLIYNLTYQIELYIAGALLVHKKRYLTVPFNCFLHTQILC